MELRLSDRVLSIKPSPTLAVTNRAAELKAAGKDIIGLGAGEPDFDTPEHIKAAAIKAIQDGFTKYTAVDGTAGLKKAIIAKLKRDNGLDYQANQILVSCGGKQSFFNLALAFLNKGDEVIIPAPYWVSYPDMVLIADATPVCIECPQSQNYKITPAQLEAAITPNTKLLVLNSPSNPTGMVYSKEELDKYTEEFAKCPEEYKVRSADWTYSEDRYGNVEEKREQYADCTIFSKIDKCPIKLTLLDTGIANDKEIDIIGTVEDNQNIIDVGVDVGVLVGVFVGVFVGVTVGVCVGVLVGVSVGVTVGV